MREQRVESVEVVDVGDDRVIAVVKAVGQTAHFDQEVEMNWAWLITVQDGKGTRVETFTDKAQALKAAGLGE
jgi:ketosteroid isomerase-like protein